VSEVELDELARKIVAGLGSHVIPAALPRSMGDLLRAECLHGAMYQMHNVQVGKLWFTMRYILSPDGIIAMEMQDVNGARMWEGRLISE
jgi:hypothetical protein